MLVARTGPTAKNRRRASGPVANVMPCDYIDCAPRPCKLLRLLHTYIPDSHFCKAIFNNYLIALIQREFQLSEKYTVRGSIVRAARVIASIYIVANGGSSTASRSKSAIRDLRIYLYNPMTSPRCKCTPAAPCGQW